MRIKTRSLEIPLDMVKRLLDFHPLGNDSQEVDILI